MGNARRYEDDFFGWATEQAALLRAGRVGEADLANIAEEIDSMGRSEKRELVSRLAVLFAHLLKWQFQPALRSNSWRLTLREQRRKLARHLQDNPSLRPLLGQAATDGYGDALLDVQRETGLAETTFPPTAPWTVDEVLDDSFLPK